MENPMLEAAEQGDRSPTRRRALVAVGLLAAVLAAVVVTGALTSLDPTGWDLGALGAATYPLAGGLAFLEVGTPLGLVAPSELAVPFAGAAAAAGAVHLVPLILVVWACTAAGDSTGFATGRLLGDRVADRLRRRGGRATRHHDTLVGHFVRHGTATVLVARWLPYARTATPLVAGASRMPYPRFLAASVVGSGVWSAALCSLGYVSYLSVDVVMQRVGEAGAAVLVLVLVTLSVRAFRRSRAAGGAGR